MSWAAPVAAKGEMIHHQLETGEGGVGGGRQSSFTPSLTRTDEDEAHSSPPGMWVISGGGWRGAVAGFRRGDAP